MPNQQHQQFHGYNKPNYTQVPDTLFDEQLAELSGSELKVLLYVMRRTYGFKKDADNISIDQMRHGITKRTGEVLDRGTGLSKQSICSAVKSLEEKGILLRNLRQSKEKGDEATTYALNVGGPVSKNWTPPCQEIGHPRVQKLDTQETGRQETDISNRKQRGEKEPTTVEQEQAATHNRRPRRSGTSGFVTVRDVLRRRLVPVATTDDRAIIGAYIADLHAEFADRASLTSSTSRALNLCSQKRLNVDAFIHYLYEARALTRERAALGKEGIKRPMAYFFNVLEDRLGLKPPAPGAT